tara:strand:+ start:36 stop:839 length:804 start_codon:yes stop_codon:yes gene_type:complete
MNKKAYVIGSETSKSLSPQIFNYWFRQKKISGEYFYKQIKEKDFGGEVDKILNEENLCGFNITIPFKEKIIYKLDDIDEHAKNIGAVNQVIKKNDKWLGKNTDWIGFTNAIKGKITLNKKKKALVLGYGGAAKAIVYALEKLGFEEICIYNRSAEKLSLIEKKHNIVKIQIGEITQNIEDSSIIINTTPVDILKEVPGFNKHPSTKALDIVYQPKDTKFLSRFEKSNRIYGIAMLVNQAAPCFEDWYGIKPEVDQALFEFLDQVLSS